MNIKKFEEYENLQEAYESEPEEFQILMERFEDIIAFAEHFGSSADDQPDMYGDWHGHEIKKKLKQLYNAAIYGDRNAGREREIFKSKI